MIDKKLLTSLKENYQASEAQRRQINSAANAILFESKKTIFAIQRNDFKIAGQKLNELEKSLAQMDKRFGSNRLQQEGSYRAAVEEYLESRTLYDIIKERKIKPVKNLNLDYSGYLGGICDMIGELVRYATNAAAAGKFSEVAKIKKMAEDIMAQLVDFDMTGYLRTKYDQSRNHLRKLEQMSYEIKLRSKK